MKESMSKNGASPCTLPGPDFIFESSTLVLMVFVYIVGLAALAGPRPLKYEHETSNLALSSLSLFLCLLSLFF